MSGYDRQRSGREQSFQERRRKVDWVVRMATALSLIAWTVAFAVWIVLEMASPEKETMFASLARSNRTVFGANETVIRDYWDTTLLPIAFLLLVAALAICIVAFFFNKARMRRKTDKYRKSVIIIGAITIVGIVLFLVRFGLPFGDRTDPGGETQQTYSEPFALPDRETQLLL